MQPRWKAWKWSTTMSEQRQDHNTDQIRAILAQASPDQIRRLIDDIRETKRVERPS